MSGKPSASQPLPPSLPRSLKVEEEVRKLAEHGIKNLTKAAQDAEAAKNAPASRK